VDRFSEEGKRRARRPVEAMLTLADGLILGHVGLARAGEEDVRGAAVYGDIRPASGLAEELGQRRAFRDFARDRRNTEQVTSGLL
jgi:hypothetical protein